MNIVSQSSQYGIRFSNFVSEFTGITSPTSRLRGVCDYPSNRAKKRKRAGKEGFSHDQEGGGGSAGSQTPVCEHYI